MGVNYTKNAPGNKKPDTAGDDSDRMIPENKIIYMRERVVYGIYLLPRRVQQFRQPSLLARCTDGFVLSILMISPGICLGAH